MQRNHYLGCLALAIAAVIALSDMASAATLEIKAHVDGRSQLHLQGGQMRWLNIRYAAPGRHQGMDQATQVDGGDWFPEWPDIPDAENRHCMCYSSALTEGVPDFSPSSGSFQLNQIDARQEVRIIDYPSARNNYGLIIEFNDTQGGSADYHVQLTWEDQFQINPGINDAWFDPVTPGQGFFINVLPEFGQIFLSWFTYDTERPPEDLQAVVGEPGHRWLTAQGLYDLNQSELAAYLTHGGLFNSPEPAPTTSVAGTISLLFEHCNKGVLTYSFDDSGLEGSIPIQRVVNESVGLCESFHTGQSGAAND